MSPKNPEASDFLRSRRARLEPSDVGLPSIGGPRRVPGLRREEAAILAGVSVDYYTRLEKGNLAGVSDTVLDAIANALKLDGAERSYLFDLARAASPGDRRNRTPRRTWSAPRLRTSAQHLVNAIQDVPVMAHNRRLDILALNPLAQALFSSVLTSPTRSVPPAPVNLARYVFLDPAAEHLYLDLRSIAAACVGMLRAEAGRTPHDSELSTLVGELSTRSMLFAELWADHQVALHDHGTKTMHHEIIGDIELGYETLPIDADTGHVVTFYYPSPGSAATAQLRLLASWATAAVTSSQEDIRYQEEPGE